MPVLDLNFTLDSYFKMNDLVSTIGQTYYFELRHLTFITRTLNFELPRLATIRRFFTNTSTATFVSTWLL